jgi:trans-AT polyketide synthase/acyltransferase/oxidoreductase domain-containing protein
VTARRWRGDPAAIAFDPAAVRERLRDLAAPLFVVRAGGRHGVAAGGEAGPEGEHELVAAADPVDPGRLGEPAFRSDHGVRLAYAAGPMANGIASADLVCAMGRAGLLASFGAAGLTPDRVEGAIRRVQAELPEGPYAFNLIHSPAEETLEAGAVDLYLRHGVRTVEASAYLDLTRHVVRYRAAGLRLSPAGRVERDNRVIAKVSRREVARKFMEPPPARLLGELVAAGLLGEEQARLAERVPVCDDVTVEADSGGHTDNRPLVVLLPSILELRDQIQAARAYESPLRVGAAGGIGAPEAALAAFAMGAAYVVTGSVNQACRESGSSPHVRRLLAQADMADVMMAPAADMFEMGVKVQLLKRGTQFPMRAQRLYELYRQHDSLEALPRDERERLERQVFRRPLEEIWRETVTFFRERDPAQIERAEGNPKRRMALVFRWYLGLSSRWANAGEPGREMDYQVWCGPSMGAFNDWARGSYLEAPESRGVVDVAENLMAGAAYLHRLAVLRAQGFDAAPYRRYEPRPPA